MTHAEGLTIVYVADVAIPLFAFVILRKLNDPPAEPGKDDMHVAEAREELERFLSGG